MKRGVLTIILGAGLCMGCATVDLRSMVGSDQAAVATVETESNVIERAVEKLRAVFASRGFGEKASQKKMQATANILLNGLVDASQSTDPDYNDSPRLIAEVRADMAISTRHVDQTTHAAQVYLEVASSDRELDAELDQLQTALLASDRAARGFAEALDGYETGLSERNTDLAEFRRSVDALRTVTDAFGDRVRLTRSNKFGLDAATVG